MQRAIIIAVMAIPLFALGPAAASAQGAIEYEQCIHWTAHPGHIDETIFSCSHIAADTTLPSDMRAQALSERSFMYRRKGDQKHALDDLDAAIKLDAKPYLLVNRAFIYEIQKDYARAIDDLTSAIAINPKDASTYLWRGEVYKRKGDKDRAADDFRHSLALNPGDNPDNKAAKQYLTDLGFTQ